MQARHATAAALLFIGAAALSGCSEGGLAGTLRATGAVSSPDEFMVLPTKPLEIPQNLAALPPPQPGTANRVDRNPEVEAVAGLTGRQPTAGGASAGPLLARAGPADPTIRSRLAQEDAAYRSQNGGLLLERVFTNDPERLTYRGMILYAPGEFEQLRAAGMAVPPASPRVLSEEVAPPEPSGAELRRRGWNVPAAPR